MKAATKQDEQIVALLAENRRLIALLDAHQVEWRIPPMAEPALPGAESQKLSAEEKIALFRRLFRGRTDV